MQGWRLRRQVWNMLLEWMWMRIFLALMWSWMVWFCSVECWLGMRRRWRMMLGMRGI